MAGNNKEAFSEDEMSGGIISRALGEYAGAHTSPEPEVLKQLSRETYLKTTAPQMLSGHLQGAFLRMISRMLKPELVLEIGTFTGYSAICLAEGIRENGMLHTVECNPEMEDIARRYFSLAGLSEKIILHIGDAFEIVEKIEGPFDLVFIDANKDDYIRYFDLVFGKVAGGGFIIADNVLWYGRVTDKNASVDRETRSIVAFNEYIQHHNGVENLLLPVRDGLMIMRKL